MVMTCTLGVEATHGHDIAADIDGGAAQPVVEMKFQKKCVDGGVGMEMQQNNCRDDIITDTVVEKISLTKCRRRSSICSRIRL